MAIRDNRIAAESIGINITKYKLLAFSISAGLAGVAGVLYAHNLTTLTAQPKNFGYNMSIMILVYVVLGGIGSVTGSVLGAFLVTSGRELLRFFDDPLTIAGVHIPLFRSGFRMVIFSILLMVVVLFYRRGIMGNNEFSWDGLFRLIRGIPDKLKKGRGKKAASKKGGAR